MSWQDPSDAEILEALRWRQQGVDQTASPVVIENVLMTLAQTLSGLRDAATPAAWRRSRRPYLLVIDSTRLALVAVSGGWDTAEACFQALPQVLEIPVILSELGTCFVHWRRRDIALSSQSRIWERFDGLDDQLDATDVFAEQTAVSYSNAPPNQRPITTDELFAYHNQLQTILSSGPGAPYHVLNGMSETGTRARPLPAPASAEPEPTQADLDRMITVLEQRGYRVLRCEAVPITKTSHRVSIRSDL